MNKSISYAGAFLAISVSTFSFMAHGQSTISLERCSKAVQSVERFTMASADRHSERLLNHTISPDEHAHHVQRLEDFKDRYTLSRCMEGHTPDVYQCLISQPGDLTLCTQ
ncbi:MAG: hypothetical protein K6L80_09835 [Agarilytica sp.]